MRYDSFLNIIEDDTSKYHKIKKEDYQPFGLFPIIDQGQEFIGGYTDDENLIAKENLPVIIFGDHTRIFKYVDFPFTIGADGVKVLLLKNQSFNTKFYYYFLKTLRLTNAGYSRHFKYLKVCKLPILDNVDNQLQIASILTKAESLISQRKESIHLLDEYLKSTFLEMFGDPVINEKGWKLKTIEEIGKDYKRAIKAGPFGSQLLLSELQPFGIPVYGIDNVQKNKFIEAKPKFITEKKFIELIAFKIEAEDILITRTGTVGRTCLAPENINKSIIGPNLLKITLDKTKVLPIFISIAFNYCESIVESIKQLSPGATIAVFNTTNLKAIKLGIPPLEYQIRFAQIVEKAESLKTQYQQSLVELENLYGSLSQKAFRGELSFKEEGLMIAAEPKVPYSFRLLENLSK